MYLRSENMVEFAENVWLLIENSNSAYIELMEYCTDLSI